MQIGHFKITCTSCGSEMVAILARINTKDQEIIVLKCRDCKIEREL